MNLLQSLMIALKQEALPLVATPLETFFAAVKPVNNQPVSMLTFLAARIQLAANLLAAGPQALGATEADVITILQADLAGYAAKPAPAAPTT